MRRGDRLNEEKSIFPQISPSTSFALAVVASPLTITGAVAQEKAGFTLRAPEQGFRVLPYLQSPASTSMTISWVSELNEPGTVRVSGPGMKALNVTSTPKYMDLMEYTEKELNQELNYNAGMERNPFHKAHGLNRMPIINIP